METVELTVPSLSGDAERFDVENVLVGISGVGHVRIDTDRHTVTVDYDPDYGHPRIIRGSVHGAGYPVTEMTGPVDA
jgi:copper chaperone CopZ